MSINRLSRGFAILGSALKGSKYAIRPGYIHKKTTTHFDDTNNEDEWQKEVYSFALETFQSNSFKKVLDIGCGSAYKLRSSFDGLDFTGSEIEPTLTYLKSSYPLEKWKDLKDCYNESYDLIILSDVIEHIDNPSDFLKNIINNIPFKKMVISTPDRSLLEGSSLGPALNPSHYREWTTEEFKRFISTIMNVEDHFISNKEQATQVVLASHL